ncbi:YihY/virulence factor BrkB family protein [Pararobbsia silviterrae]|uniref:YihY/virulence factor BrkB family protein n=2 Tax=Pararobbsia silviterrae TaxID=1792498 RepID=A0A494YER1_9BURK|nr:YihY/virulence factor BrkB family protein [Pararobbsia silviterrae]
MDKARLRRWADWVVEPVLSWIGHRGASSAASIAFYTAFSLSPTLVIVIAVASFAYGADAIQGRLFDQIRGVVGNDAAGTIQAMVANARHANLAAGTTLISLVAVLVGASATFSSLHAALNLIWPIEEAHRKPTDNLISLVKLRLISFGLVVGVGFLVVVLQVLDTVVNMLGRWVWGQSSVSYLLANGAQHLTSVAVLICAFSALLKFLPDAVMEWRDSTLGAVAAALLFGAGKNLFSVYLAHAGTANMFGAAGSLAVILMWLYYSSAVFLFGAEVAAYSAKERARRQVPETPSPDMYRTL